MIGQYSITVSGGPEQVQQLRAALISEVRPLTEPEMPEVCKFEYR